MVATQPQTDQILDNYLQPREGPRYRTRVIPTFERGGMNRGQGLWHLQILSNILTHKL